MIIGIIGKTNSGKSSFFKAATMIDVEIGDRTFVTIKPNVGIAYVVIDCVCKEFNVKCNPKSGKCVNGRRYIPVKLWDVAGLVPDAHLGKGLGLQFLDDIRQASVLVNIVDFSGLTDSEGKPTIGYDPARDVEFVEKEIDLWFAGVIRRAVEKFQSKLARTSKADLLEILSQQLSGLEIIKNQIQQVLDKVSIADIERFAQEIRKISKPIIIAANKIDLKSSQENFERLKGNYKFVIPVSAEAEIALRKGEEKGIIDYQSMNGFEIKGSLDEKQKNALEFIKQNIVEKYGSTGVQACLNKAVFELLDYIAVYPVADANKLTDKDKNVLPDVFLVPRGTTVKEFAFRVHTELGEKFICGIDGRTKRRLSADYQLKNRDVVEIAFAK